MIRPMPTKPARFEVFEPPPDPRYAPERAQTNQDEDPIEDFSFGEFADFPGEGAYTQQDSAMYDASTGAYDGYESAGFPAAFEYPVESPSPGPSRAAPQMQAPIQPRYSRDFSTQPQSGPAGIQRPAPFKPPVPVQSRPAAAAVQSSHVAHHPSATTQGSSGPSSIRRRPVSDLHDIYRGFFGFPVFNAVQSACFDTIFHSPFNAVITAPTGTGKTVLFELAIIRLLENDSSAKAVYLAPTKSLCSERYKDWAERFRPLSVQCVELTGDTGNAGLNEAKRASLIITTPEKWDAMTRRWHEHQKVLSTIRLVCLDEVHLLREERGSVLEVVVSRMKTLGTNIRLVAVSATVPNIEDVGLWLGDGGQADPTTPESVAGTGSARIFRFGEEFRPVKLAKHVYGYRRSKEQSEYQFMSTLNYKLMDLIKQHSSRKPTLVFCGTRKSAEQAAEIIAKAYRTDDDNGSAPWPRPVGRTTISHKSLGELMAVGIGFHHGGVDVMDRKQVESMFIEGSLKVLCTTSTLSVGVNLPARCVIIRGTKFYAGQSFASYTDLEILQMMGRAGRPQFDNEGVAVVMTEMDEKSRFEKMVRSETVLESCLHLSLTEHINSEVALGTLTSVEGAIAWLRNSFLYIRIQKNPKHYAVVGSTELSPDKQLEDYVHKALELLAKDGMLSREEDGDTLVASDLGDIMSKFVIKYTTFLKLLNLKPKASLRNLLEVISTADEFASLRLRPGEAATYNAVNSHPDIMFPLTGKVSQTPQKVSLLIQVVLGMINTSELKTENGASNPNMEILVIWQSLPRICKCLVELAIAKRDPGVKSALELHRSVSAKAWEATPAVLRQLDQIGEKSARLLADRGIQTLQHVVDPMRINTILNRSSPFGERVVKQAQSFPQFQIGLVPLGEEVADDGVCVELEVQVSIKREPEPTLRVKNRTVFATVLVMTSSSHSWVEFRRIRANLLLEQKEFTVSCILVKPSDKIVVYAATEQFAGIGATAAYTPTTDRDLYPKPKFSAPPPMTEGTDELLEGLQEGDLDFDEEELRDVGSGSKKVVPKKTVATVGPVKKRAITVDQDDDDEPEPGSDKLPNGRYRCAHKCKSCKHDCCINGMDKPSQSRRLKKLRRLEEQEEDENSTKPKFKPLIAKKSSAAAKYSATPSAKSTGSLLDALKRVDSTKKNAKGGSQVSAKVKVGQSQSTKSKASADVDIDQYDDELPEIDEAFFSDPPTAGGGETSKKPASAPASEDKPKYRQPIMRAPPLPARKSTASVGQSPSSPPPQKQKKPSAVAGAGGSKSVLDKFRSTTKHVEAFDETKAFSNANASTSQSQPQGQAQRGLFRPASPEVEEEEVDELESDGEEVENDEAQHGIGPGQALGQQDNFDDYSEYLDLPANIDPKPEAGKAAASGPSTAKNDAGADVEMSKVEDSEGSQADFMAWCETLVGE